MPRGLVVAPGNPCAALENQASEPSSKDITLSSSTAANTPAPNKDVARFGKYLAAYGEPLNYPVDAAAWAIGVGRSTLWQMIKNGLVETVKIGRRRLIPKEEVHRIKRGTSALMSKAPGGR
jgi:excisionase family DNA binding protein